MVLFLLACTAPDGVKPPPGEDTAPSVDTDTAADTDTALDTATDTADDTDTAAFPDADGDGHAPLSAGGDDCDDTNPWVHPGAVEYCSPIDEDCDGEAYEEGVCGEPTEVGPGAIPILVDHAGWNMTAGLIGDVTGDGRADVLVVERGGEGWLFSGAELGPVPTGDGTERAWHYFEGDSSGSWNTPLPAGDVDGDGVDDVFFTDMHDGETFLHHGPIASGASALAGDADARGAPGAGGDVSVGVSWAGTDLDGDGRAEVALSYAADTGYELTGPALEVLRGGRWDERCAVTRGEPVSYGAVMGPLGDADGDGMVETLFSMGGTHHVVEGEDFALVCDTPIDVLVDPIGVRSLQEAFPVEDLDGDGIVEVVAVQDRFAEEDEDGLLFYSASQFLDPAFVVEDVRGSYLMDGELTAIMDAQVIDLGADGTLDLVLPGGIVIRGGRLPAPHESFPRYLDLDGGAVCTSLACGGDATGDGLADLLAMSSESGIYDVSLVPGFEIPWDEPSYW